MQSSTSHFPRSYPCFRQKQLAINVPIPNGTVRSFYPVSAAQSIQSCERIFLSTLFGISSNPGLPSGILALFQTITHDSVNHEPFPCEYMCFAHLSRGKLETRFPKDKKARQKKRSSSLKYQVMSKKCRK